MWHFIGVAWLTQFCAASLSRCECALVRVLQNGHTCFQALSFKDHAWNVDWKVMTWFGHFKLWNTGVAKTLGQLKVFVTANWFLCWALVAKFAKTFKEWLCECCSVTNVFWVGWWLNPRVKIRVWVCATLISPRLQIIFDPGGLESCEGCADLKKNALNLIVAQMCKKLV